MVRRDGLNLRRANLAALMVLVASGGLAVSFVPPSSADLSDVAGGAYGISAQISLFGGAQPADVPTPTIALPPGGSSTPVTATAPSGLVRHGPAVFFTSDRLDVSTVGTNGPGGSVTSSVDILNINRSTVQAAATGSEIFYADNLHSSCTANDSGISGTATLANAQLQLDSGDDTAGDVHPVVNVPLPSNPPPSPPGARQNPPPPPQDQNLANRGHIHVNGSIDHFHVVFNEQISNPDGSLTVNAVHEFLDGPTAVGEVIIGQVRCAATRVAPAPTAPPRTGVAPPPTAVAPATSSTAPATSTSSTSSTTLLTDDSSSTSSSVVPKASKTSKGGSSKLPLALGAVGLVAVGTGAALAGRRIRARGGQFPGGP